MSRAGRESAQRGLAVFCEEEDSVEVEGSASFMDLGRVCPPKEAHCSVAECLDEEAELGPLGA
jgi:hypothetical protein